MIPMRSSSICSRLSDGNRLKLEIVAWTCEWTTIREKKISSMSLTDKIYLCVIFLVRFEEFLIQLDFVPGTKAGLSI